MLLSAVQSGYWFMAFIAILTSVISASYYLRVVVLLVTASEKDYISSSDIIITITNTNTNTNTNRNNSLSLEDEFILTNLHSLLISTITLSILLFIFKPTLLLNSIQLLTLSLFNY